MSCFTIVFLYGNLTSSWVMALYSGSPRRHSPAKNEGSPSAKLWMEGYSKPFRSHYCESLKGSQQTKMADNPDWTFNPREGFFSKGTIKAKYHINNMIRGFCLGVPLGSFLVNSFLTNNFLQIKFSVSSFCLQILVCFQRVWMAFRLQVILAHFTLII